MIYDILPRGINRSLLERVQGKPNYNSLELNRMRPCPDFIPINQTCLQFIGLDVRHAN